jgi:hypothetical protein
VRRILVAASLAVCGVAGCGPDVPDPKAPPPRPPPAAAPAAAAANPASPVAAVRPLNPNKDALLAEVRKRQLGNEDFVEGEANRDPFRSFLSTFAVQPTVVGKQHKIIMEKFTLDELKLVGIVSGDGVSPRAMFVDPGGLGVSVVRGDHVSKADALVTRIAPDRVFFQLEEDMGGGKTKSIERVVELHAGELVAQ